MALRNIVYSDNEFIRKISKPVNDYNENLWELLDDMKETMIHSDGCGLAAIQVGVLKNVVVIDVYNMYLELVNPEIIEFKGKQRGIEGCLSVKDLNGYVTRPNRVTVKAYDRYGHEFVITGTGLLARALCHEIDHLHGVLFTDIMDEPVEKRIKANKKKNND